MVLMNKSEAKFMKTHSLSRLATASLPDCMPHVVPVVHALDRDDSPIIAIDYGTKKLKNLRENPKAALLVDDGEAQRCVMIQGECEVHERGAEYLRLLKILFERFDFYRNDPWGEGESPILKIRPEKVVSWGL
jgi:nitroimidazol reductase NimA-like FMN-containing flavoprotein (pyridoxamine 5'-phosphate oxidase superfamily)